MQKVCAVGRTVELLVRAHASKSSQLVTAMTDVAVIARVLRARGHYEVLGIERDAGADDVKRAFRGESEHINWL